MLYGDAAYVLSIYLYHLCTGPQQHPLPRGHDKRGQCKVEGCDCDEFKQPERGAKCDTCKHVPIKHTLIEEADRGGGSLGELVM